MGGVRACVGLLAVLAWACVGVRGHGRLIEPPGRSTAWRWVEEEEEEVDVQVEEEEEEEVEVEEEEMEEEKEKE